MKKSVLKFVVSNHNVFSSYVFSVVTQWLIKKIQNVLYVKKILNLKKYSRQNQKLNKKNDRRIPAAIFFYYII
jgi:hypothetical protein